MLGTAGLVFVSFALAVFASVRRAAGWLMGLALLGFLGSAMAGTFERIQGVPVGDVSTQGSRLTSVLADATGHATQPRPSPTHGEANDDEREGSTPAGAQENEPPLAAVTTRASAEALPPVTPAAAFSVPPLPSEPEAQLAAVRAILRDAKKLIDEPTRCIEPAALGAVWARLRAVPPNVEAAKVRVIVRKLEQCRRKVYWVETYAIHHRAVESRDAVDDVLTRRIESKGIPVAIAVYGMDHEQIRIGVRPSIEEARVRALVDDALARELEDLGFARVLVSYGERLWTHELAPTPERELVSRHLATYGLERPFAPPS